ncbi:hypothetical protein, conserved [Leishmania tarentolae]|uniref:Uncharacterized protein n=1 Tax=Leishmania tarentolae TaxID=5689 RepID=A0A640KLP3_LEITA|nr:hypothetical protein, conserved [Leishmania tarentolae]
MNANIAGDSSGGSASTEGSASSVVPPVTVSFVTNEQEFAAVFKCESSSIFSGSRNGGSISTDHSRDSDSFLLCYEHPGDGVTAESLLQFKNSVTAAAQQYGARLRLFIWDCTSPSFAAARTQLDKRHGHPLLLIVFKGAIADTLRDMPLTEMSATEVPRVCSRLASFQSSAKPARVVATGMRSTPVSTIATATSTAEGSDAGSLPQEAEQHLSVDVAKMVGMGKRLMAERQPFYAEKFFVKALRTLDAVSADMDPLLASREDYHHSVAMCLAWAGLAQLVQGKQTVENAYLERLDREAALQPFRDAPLNDASRALTTWRLMQDAPRPWSETRDSEAKLRAALSSEAHDNANRSLLVITLFLKGDVECAITEALKLHVCGDVFGRVALKHISRFLGRDHVLVKRLGIPELTESI